MCGAKIPHRLLTKLEAVESDPEAVHQRRRRVRDACSAATCCSTTCDGLHFYTLNKSKATVDIVKQLNVDHAV